MPQVRISEEHGKDLVDFSRLLNADLIWINASAAAHEATLTNSLNTIGVPALLVEMGLGNRVTRSFGDQITEGIFNLMHEIGIWSGPVGRDQKCQADKRLWDRLFPGAVHRYFPAGYGKRTAGISG